jgi:zinc protease
MTVSAISDATFEQEVLKSTQPVLVEFTADWCGPCKAMAPALDHVAKELSGKVKIVTLDVDQNPTVRDKYNVRGMPTLILFKNGEPAVRRLGSLAVKEKLREWIDVSVSASEAPTYRAAEFKLSNGLEVAVIVDRRAPFVAHAVWYRVGAADAPKGAAGIAHLVERLTEKSLEKFAESERGPKYRPPRENSLEAQDATVFYRRVDKDQLQTAMEIEADRMLNLRLTETEIAAEQQLVIDERRGAGSRTDEQMYAALYQSHPYGVPATGLVEDLEKLLHEDVLAFHDRYYAPNNAILVVAGDVSPEEVKELAEKIYGKVPARAAVERQSRPGEPPHVTARQITLRNARVRDPWLQRYYLVPSYRTAKAREAEALELLLKVIVADGSSRLQGKPGADEKAAGSISGRYLGYGRDYSVLSLAARASNGDLGAVEAGVDAMLDDIRKAGVTQLELENAKKSALLDHQLYDSDEPAKLAERYGRALAEGRTIQQVEGWPDAISKVTTEDIRTVANDCLDARHAVTGWLVPEGQRADDQAA